jgi:hypothetical protein
VIDHVVGADSRAGEFASPPAVAITRHWKAWQSGWRRTDAAGCRQHQDILAGLEFGTRHEHVPRGGLQGRGGGSSKLISSGIWTALYSARL